MKRVIFTLLYIVVFATACKKNNDGSGVAVTPTGSAYGYITLRDEFGSLIKPSGLNVALSNGTSTVASVISDTLGRYNIANLAEGAYNVSFAGTNIANYKTFGRNIIAGSTLNYFGNQALYQNCTAIIDTLNIAAEIINSGAGISVKGAVTTPANLPELGKISYVQSMHLFFSKNPAVSSQAYTYSLSFSIAYNVNKRTVVNFSASLNSLYTFGFQSGDVVYVVGYMGPNSGGYGYTDCTTNLYPCIATYCGLSNPSQTGNFILQ